MTICHNTILQEYSLLFSVWDQHRALSSVAGSMAD